MPGRRAGQRPREHFELSQTTREPTRGKQSASNDSVRIWVLFFLERHARNYNYLKKQYPGDLGVTLDHREYDFRIVPKRSGSLNFKNNKRGSLSMCSLKSTWETKQNDYTIVHVSARTRALTFARTRTFLFVFLFIMILRVYIYK